MDFNTEKKDILKDQELSLHKKKLKEADPIVLNASKDHRIQELSAMDPPDAYDNEFAVGLDKEQYNKFLRDLMDEHKELITKVNEFDEALATFRAGRYIFSRDVSESFNRFFKYFDEHILPHNRKEEQYYFRIIHKRLIESGEHGNGSNPGTAVDIMEDDHVKFIQLASITFNFLGLASRLHDPESRSVTFDLAYNTGRELVELIRLHIFREDETLFPLSQKLLTEADFKIINDHI
ncbi:MAG TPA: hemerythrin domain-containing protein [Saprospiraceae bacterium]|jgi:iron-sulfur cluster repair protein YtfE (RIC family)|nr:hemerythrin domain-containing protein [Saprospiraceae bacterium]HRO07340.1 hemerythrin domain-containing protein [Saprospiraceae bacterium]HRO73091.1 hemerythrin domain-containing protein [Saprospiraceae bacterium]HRP40623.1 hemerythrin domain-containing protein [Saprospiraceae bacterium]